MAFAPARRDLIKGVAGLSLATILSDRVLAQASASQTKQVHLTLPDGRKVEAAIAFPETKAASAVLLIHEWWGLNDQIKSMAAALAGDGYIALAVDLFNGQVTDNPDQAKAQTAGVKSEEANATLGAWVDWLKKLPEGNGKVATLGWCFGGGWSLMASLIRPVDATIIYYGRVNVPAAQLVALKGPVLGQFAKKDQFIDKVMVDGFRAEMQKAGKPVEIYEYDADHGFANPTTARYDQEDAQAAWARTLEFLKKTLG